MNGADRGARILCLTTKGEKLYGQLRPVDLAANKAFWRRFRLAKEVLIGLLIRVVEGNLAQETRVLSGRKRRLRQ